MQNPNNVRLFVRGLAGLNSKVAQINNKYNVLL